MVLECLTVAGLCVTLQLFVFVDLLNPFEPILGFDWHNCANNVCLCCVCDDSSIKSAVAMLHCVAIDCAVTSAVSLCVRFLGNCGHLD